MASWRGGRSSSDREGSTWLREHKGAHHAACWGAWWREPGRGRSCIAVTEAGDSLAWQVPKQSGCWGKLRWLFCQQLTQVAQVC